MYIKFKYILIHLSLKKMDYRYLILNLSAFKYKSLNFVIYLWSTLTKKEFLKCISLMLTSNLNYSTLEFKDSFKMRAPGLHEYLKRTEDVFISGIARQMNVFMFHSIRLPDFRLINLSNYCHYNERVGGMRG